jgi:hypothetical protein
MKLGSPTRLDGPRTVTIPLDWEPSPENTNALPGPLREYIHDLIATQAFSADLVQTNWELQRTNAALRAHPIPRCGAAGTADGIGETPGQVGSHHQASEGLT